MQDSTTVPIDSGASKQPRFRSVAYPSNTIFHCVELVGRINKQFGNLTYTTRDSISKELGISDSHLQTQLSSCVQYGLLELKSGDGYRPTQLYKAIYKPLPTEDPRDSLIECFKSPDLYKSIISIYDNDDLPQLGGLASILYRNHKVSEAASTVAAKIFIENAKELELLTGDYAFSLNTKRRDKDEIPFQDIDKNGEIVNGGEPLGNYILLPPNIKPPIENRNPKEQKIPVLLDDGSISEVPLPNGIIKGDIERIIKILTAYL